MNTIERAAQMLAVTLYGQDGVQALAAPERDRLSKAIHALLHPCATRTRT